MSGERRRARPRCTAWTLRVLDRLGAPPEEQVAYIRRVDVGTDELLLEFDDVVFGAKAMLYDGLLSASEFEALRRVEVRAESVDAGGTGIWTDAAVAEAAEWPALRSVAGTVKSELAEAWELWEYLE
ncbi:hypothetical protein [Streptomyces goshikiensis]|uniref:hypothetical protein n=1 Tax=Streptomyces goshikiensis TaxID=1942 RepID=UPI0033ACA15F